MQLPAVWGEDFVWISCPVWRCHLAVSGFISCTWVYDFHWFFVCLRCSDVQAPPFTLTVHSKYILMDVLNIDFSFSLKISSVDLPQHCKPLYQWRGTSTKAKHIEVVFNQTNPYILISECITNNFKCLLLLSFIFKEQINMHSAYDIPMVMWCYTYLIHFAWERPWSCEVGSWRHLEALINTSHQEKRNAQQSHFLLLLFSFLVFVSDCDIVQRNVAETLS